MNFNIGDVVRYQDIHTLYQILEFDTSKTYVIKLGLLKADKTPFLNDINEQFTIRSTYGWCITHFTLIDPVIQGPIPKYYTICQKIKAMDKRFSERKLA